MPPVCFTVTRPSLECVAVHMKVTHRSEQWFLLSSDRHHDNKKCLQALEKEHLDEALKRKAGILDFGDLFCAMQGKWDPRSSKRDLRPEHCGDNYLDALTKTAFQFYKPYARNFVMLSPGNHETKIADKTGTFLSERLVTMLNTVDGANVQLGGYSGWCRFYFQRHTERCSRTLWYIHGYGGGGPVTKDMIQRNRQQAIIEGADIMCSGHTHDAWNDHGIKQILNGSCFAERLPVNYVKVGTYKDAYGTGAGGWDTETGKPPKPLGAWWLRFYYKGGKLKQETTFTE